MLELALILLIAFVLDCAIGDPLSGLHPVALLGRWAAKMEKICRRLLGSSISAGALAWLLVILTAVMPVLALTYGAERLNFRFSGAIMAGIWLYVCIALRSLWQHADKVRRPLASGDLQTARDALSMIVSRDTQNLTESEIARGTIESLGENLVDAVNSGVFWAVVGFVIGGAPLAAAFAILLRTANTLDACWGYQNERYLTFGRIAACTDDLLHFLPARLSLLTTALAAPFVGGKPLNALRCGYKHRHDHPSPNSAWGMATFAGALDIRLGGLTIYAGISETNPYLGRGRSQLTTNDIRRAQRLSVCSALFFAGLMLGLAYLVLFYLHN